MDPNRKLVLDAHAHVEEEKKRGMNEQVTEREREI